MSGLYNNQISSPSSIRANSNINMRNNFDLDSSQYLAELLAEHQKLGPFVQVLPFCSRLLNQEILRVSGKNNGLLMQNQGISSEYENRIMQFGSHKPTTLVASSDMSPNFTGWNSLSHEMLGGGQGLNNNVDWQTAPLVSSPHIVKKILRLDIPSDSYPNFNFVGRLLGPRGNSLKRVEATTGCRVYIRGKGSIKDLDKEELLRGRPGYEHLNEPLHVLIEAELPPNIVDLRLRQAQEILQELLKPVDESQDLYKRQQLRELAMLNSNFREDSPQLSGSVSPFTSNEIKRAKLDQ
ncbi:hypothetical protein HN51_024639 [Arachis hypogaea]|uniref:K Homology domain-containing protein n=3 Tax=Arachis TaxID=3817 RepID=A0A445C7R1_ARAHY|nr:KH domain-containing protein At3g08620 [Arachis duranensis]XP_025609572.1 KH domain-containing protein At3g08620 isoform X1 [Arachis hypogaea]XP_057726688.1 KH domain-containing protein At3g08620-like isoform X1 [Arachis stenosperma]QHO27694.1 KH domain-containing protein [Arachis hypogaea]RYR46938.1 hypothetical protein Ahy_A07g032808 [Arachis hypogaea]